MVNVYKQTVELYSAQPVMALAWLYWSFSSASLLAPVLEIAPYHYGLLVQGL